MKKSWKKLTVGRSAVENFLKLELFYFFNYKYFV